jgi:alkylation response protein AidB-like acyl-CoA dehydrogenase
VDPVLTAEQELVRETAARFISSSCPLARVRDLADTPHGIDNDYIRRAAELGWFAALVPEALGGGTVSGKGVADAAVVAEERGSGLQPGAFVPINIVAHALAAGGSDDQKSRLLPAVVSGELPVAWALGGNHPAWAPGAGLFVRAGGRGVVVSGTAEAVQDAHLAAQVLVTGRTAGHHTQVLVPTSAPGVRVEPLQGLDLTRRLCRVHFDNVEVVADDVVGTIGGADSLVERQLQITLVLAVAETIGAMRRDFEMVVEYAKARIAFGRPIGSFQAIKHQLADAAVSLETSQAIATTATHAVQNCSEDAAELASAAKAYVGDAALDVALTCFQVFGGIGYTWEHDQHLYLRRLTSDAALYGSPTWHRERICRLHNL